jgi:quinol monooxygenase YgiN
LVLIAIFTTPEGESMQEEAAPFALVVRFTVRPGAEADFDSLVARTTAAIREREPGTLVYACHRVEGQPRQRIFYELYRDRVAFDLHEHQDHVRDFLATREDLLESTVVDWLALTDGKTPANKTAAHDG